VRDITIWYDAFNKRDPALAVASVHKRRYYPKLPPINLHPPTLQMKIAKDLCHRCCRQIISIALLKLRCKFAPSSRSIVSGSF
jgi:hypothetical protein